MASVPMPQAAPQAKEGEAPPEQPKSIAGLIGNLFGGAQAEAKPAEPAESEPATLARHQERVSAQAETR